MVTEKDKCKYCGKLIIDIPTGRIESNNPIVVLRDGKLAHEDCARDYWIRESREDKQCE
jgi:hypothetical protein